MRKFGEAQKALSLLEILVAVILLALIIVGSTGLFVASKGRILHSRWRITAAEAGRLFLNQLQVQVRQDQWGANCLSGGGGCPPASTIDGTQFTPVYSVFTGYNTPVTNLNRVRVTVQWIEAEVTE